MHRTFETVGAVRLVVVNEVGSVSIAAHDDTTTMVSLSAESPAAEELVEQSVIECNPSGAGEVVVVKVPHRHGAKFMRRNGVEVWVRVPLGSDVEVVTASADMDLTGSLGVLSLKTASGDIDADGSASEVTAATASGDVVLGNVDGDVRMKSASGDLRASAVAGRLNAVTASGDIEVGAVGGDRLDVRCTSGDIRLGHVMGDASIVAVSGDVRVISYGEGRMQVRSISGDLAIGIAPGVNLALDAESMSGQVRSEIPLSDRPVTNVGVPEVRVAARSVSGDVVVERALDSMVA
jgi:DUF4097 and DUF4098 domain-containing protein YvlB